MEQWDKSTENKDRPYLVVTYNHNYYCHYFKRDDKWFEFNNAFNVIELSDNNEASFLKFLDERYPTRLLWVDEVTLKIIRRVTLQRQINELRNSKETSNFKLIVEELKNDCGKIITFANDGIPLLLICAVTTEEDYYYVGIDKNMKLHYESCVGKYNIVNNKEIIQEMKKWLMGNNNEIKTVVQKALFEGFDVPFTNYSKLFNIT